MSQALQNRVGSGGGDDVALALIEGDGVSRRRCRLAGAADAIQHGAEVGKRVAALGDYCLG